MPSSSPASSRGSPRQVCRCKSRLTSRSSRSTRSSTLSSQRSTTGRGLQRRDPALPRIAKRSDIRGAPRRRSDGDDYLAACAALSEVADRSRHLVERERPVDDGPDRASFEQLPKFLQVLPTLLRDEEAELLPDERRERGGAQLTADAEPVACVLGADDHQRPPRGQ